jgi:hypothetical protein
MYLRHTCLRCPTFARWSSEFYHFSSFTRRFVLQRRARHIFLNAYGTQRRRKDGEPGNEVLHEIPPTWLAEWLAALRSGAAS